MGVLDELDYVLKPANAAQRVTQKIAASGPGAWVFQRTMYPIDKVLYKRTSGRRIRSTRCCTNAPTVG